MNLRNLLSIAFCAVSIAAAGCSSDTGNGTVTGTVTLDGQPLKNGLIRFVPEDGQTATAEAMITDGEFDVQVPIGEKRVSISAPKVVGKRQAYQTPGAPSIDIVEELLPARYNVASKLTLTVVGGSQEEEFTLQSGN
jgi:hypothetical protein